MRQNNHKNEIKKPKYILGKEKDENMGKINPTQNASNLRKNMIGTSQLNLNNA